MTLAVLAVGGVAVAQRRLANCQEVPLFASNILPNAALASDDVAPKQAAGWGYKTSDGVEVQHPSQKRGFDLDGDDRGLQMIGIANYVETPTILVQPNTSFCFAGYALTDSEKGSATRVQVVFRWLDTFGNELAQQATGWEPVALWTPNATSWSPLRAAFRAPAGAAQLRVRLQPASDDRVYLDAMSVRRTLGGAPVVAEAAPTVTLAPWPNAQSAALSFSFDWETAMGGLVHSVSLAGDPNANRTPLERGLAMRQGITDTLDLFRPYDIHATYYATGYNFLLGNTENRQFMGNPTFDWATTQNGWPDNKWKTRPWFADDPHSTAQQEPAWYFGDLIPLLQRDEQDIQSHTFSHLKGGSASDEQWRADFAAWKDVAAARNVAPARSLAFPWSSSAGMSYNDWDELEHEGITSVTRTNRTQTQYQITRPDEPHCRPVPGHERILACPDFYLTETSAPTATALIDSTIVAGGVIDLWAHTEEVVTPGQLAAWGSVVRHAAAQRDAGKLWIAPLREIADWQQALSHVSVVASGQAPAQAGEPLHFRITNNNFQPLDGLTLQLPFAAQRASTDNAAVTLKQITPTLWSLTLARGQTVEVSAWPE